MKIHMLGMVKMVSGIALVIFLFGSPAVMGDTSSSPPSDAVNPEAGAEPSPEKTGQTPPPAPYNPEAAPSPGNADGEPTADTTGADVPPKTGTPGDSNIAPTDKKEAAPSGVSLSIECSGVGVCREKLTSQPFRVLPRSFSNVYNSKNAGNENIAVENVRPFYPLYVFGREEMDLSDAANPMGWYFVSRSVTGPPIGWMQARDLLEWKQALIVSYTHPGTGEEERRRVLMFKNLQELEQVVTSDIRDQLVLVIYRNLDEGRIPPPIVSKEPQRFVDISHNFYMLPIVDYKTMDIEGDEVRCLQLAAAVPRKRGADTLEDPEYQKEAQEAGQLQGAAAKALGIDLVFVMDMTRSMQPFIDGTKAAIAELAHRIAGDRVKQKVRFGLVGYRDSVSKIPALKYTTKNFTPELVDVQRFVEILENEAKVTPIGSMDYAEEVYAGIEMGLNSAWNQDSLRFIYLVGDASAHEVGHAQSTTGKDANVLSLAARDANVHILALHLLDPRMPTDHDTAKRQFIVLSKIAGSEESALIQIKTSDKEDFTDAVKNSAGVIFDQIIQAQRGDGSAAKEKDETSDKEQPAGPGQAAKEKMEKLMASALIEYLGKEANPPKDIIVWSLDRDLTNPAIQALDVRVLVNKEQLSDLIHSIDKVIQAMARAEVSQMQFFEALQSVASQTMKNPQAISASDRLADSGLLPAFIASLPYRSEILSLTDQMYASMTAEQRSTLENGLRAKLQQYRDINEQVDGWVRLNETDPEGEKIYPLHLDYLP